MTFEGSAIWVGFEVTDLRRLFSTLESTTSLNKLANDYK
jgi:hypothetical protein